LTIDDVLEWELELDLGEGRAKGIVESAVVEFVSEQQIVKVTVGLY